MARKHWHAHSLLVTVLNWKQAHVHQQVSGLTSGGTCVWCTWESCVWRNTVQPRKEREDKTTFTPCSGHPSTARFLYLQTNIAYFSLPIAPGTRHFISCFSEFDCPGYHEEVGPCSICPLYWLILLTVMLASSILARMHGNHFSFVMWTTTLARLFHTLSTYLSLVAGRLDCLRLRLWMMLLFQ